MESEDWCYLHHIDRGIVFKSNDPKEIEKEAEKYPFGDVRAGPKHGYDVHADWYPPFDLWWNNYHKLDINKNDIIKNAITIDGFEINKYLKEHFGEYKKDWEIYSGYSDVPHFLRINKKNFIVYQILLSDGSIKTLYFNTKYKANTKQPKNEDWSNCSDFGKWINNIDQTI